MRGNEEALQDWMARDGGVFRIPMRGNESVFDLTAWRQRLEVPNPHEG